MAKKKIEKISEEWDEDELEIPDKKKIDEIIKNDMGGFRKLFEKMGVLEPKPRYYVAHPYGNNPQASFNKALNSVLFLRSKGHVPVSPVLLTHHYDLFCKQVMEQNKGKKGALTPEVIETIKKETYYAWDLDMMRGCTHMLLSNLAYIYRNACTGCGSTMSMAELQMKGKKTCCPSRKMNGPLILHWNSTGCRDEYRYAKWVLDIPIYELESFINGENIDLAELLG
jgi:hypothetical protein